ncbi:ABC transporter substrate-binding protein [Kushneria phosphatilytica]|uniref:ABC transporter substrate-binding protein n=1 Tax=Kushneria phosphatilytica TaxID=657387 RepID=A0A1S1NW52_9GAMM|nr:ABC transporter substrate-binding protein [Kushneria phosphatilytica]OHV12191.1 ABC transporter substrate-binding protein [Kushneria phosphatilytica]QEL11384.1 ABC transporter substrate-binding protein [Kushneria phosphatilytica]
MINTGVSRLALMGAVMLATAGTAQAKMLTYCSEGSPEGFNPQLYTTGTTFDASSQTIYNRLVDFKPGTTELRPSLAKSWEVSDDGKTVTFHLRHGVKFQSTDYFTPSREFNADDVLYSFNRQLNADDPWHDVNGSYEYFAGMGLPDLIDHVEKVDDYTVKFHLNRPSAPFLADMAMDFASILSKEYADQLMEAGHPERMNQQPIGTGPFTFAGYQQDAYIRYRANPDYWRGKAPLDRLVFSITPDASVRLQKLKANECQIMAYPNPADLGELKNDSNITMKSAPGLNTGYLFFNTTKAPFDKPEVRRALSMAVNREAIIDSIYKGAGTIAKNPIPSTIWSYDESTQPIAYDPEKAKALLKDAGVSNLSTDIWAMPVQRPYNPNARRMAEMIQADWQKIGVNAKIVSYEWGEYLRRLKQGEAQTGLMGWTGDNGDPDNFLYTLLSCDAAKDGSNYAKWCYKPYDKVVTEAQTINDRDQRIQLYKKAQSIFRDQLPWMPIAHSVVYMPMRSNVTGYTIQPTGSHDFYGVDLKD